MAAEHSLRQPSTTFCRRNVWPEQHLVWEMGAKVQRQRAGFTTHCGKGDDEKVCERKAKFDINYSHRESKTTTAMPWWCPGTFVTSWMDYMWISSPEGWFFITLCVRSPTFIRKSFLSTNNGPMAYLH